METRGAVNTTLTFIFTLIGIISVAYHSAHICSYFEPQQDLTEALAASIMQEVNETFTDNYCLRKRD